MARGSLISFFCFWFFFSFFSSSYFYSCLAISFFFNFICHLLTIFFKSHNYVITTVVIVLLSLLWLLLQLLFWLILPLQLFLRNKVRESSKQGILATWSTPIHHVKWWISCFRGIYRTLVVSEAGLFLILLKSLRPLCNVTRSSMLVVVGVLYLPLHFHIIVTIIVVVVCYCIINITFIVNIIFVV